MYQEFIQYCSRKNYPTGTYLEKHHIIPKFLNGSDHPANLIYLSFEDHIKAHFWRYLEFRDKRDLAAYYMMRGFNAQGWMELRRIGAQKTHTLLRKRKKHFWNSKFQKEMARRSLLRPDSLKTRSLGGQKGGYRIQKDKILNSKNRFLFHHQSGIEVCVFNCQTGGDVLREIQKVPIRPKAQLNNWPAKPQL